jgi:hypothetical protein
MDDAQKMIVPAHRPWPQLRTALRLGSFPLMKAERMATVDPKYLRGLAGRSFGNGATSCLQRPTSSRAATFTVKAYATDALESPGSAGGRAFDKRAGATVKRAREAPRRRSDGA